MANLPIKDNPTLNLQMEALTTSTPAHADRFNERYQQLLENDKALRVDAKNGYSRSIRSESSYPCRILGR